MRKAGIIIIVTLICTACGPGTTRPALRGSPEQHALELRAAKDYRAAAAEYQRLAGMHVNRESYYQLFAVQSYLDAAEVEAAAGLLGQIETRNRIEAAHRELLNARLALLQNRPAEALSFSAEAERDAPEWLRVLRHSVRAEAWERSGNPASAVLERVALSRYNLDPEAGAANVDALWSDLNRIDPGSLQKLAAANEPDLQGWIELTEMGRELGSKPEDLRSALAAWEDAHPSHAAVPTITGRILAAAERHRLVPQHVALLLPMGGQFNRAAAAIRDGFLAAWYVQSEFRPVVTIYDANSLNILDQYRQAVADGADFVVGPLEKSAVASLMQSDVQTVVTLALNRHELNGPEHRTGGQDSVLPDLIQFSLAPEDEAELAAQRAHEDGHRRALVVTSGNDWGRRLAAAFQDRWLALGGTVLEHVEYPPGSNDFSNDIRELLNVDSSDARGTQLRQQIGRPLHSGGRLRQDADVIFMAAVPVAARQIVPQLRFFGADRIPVYASSHVYTGNPNSQSDSDMNQVRFPDMPWVLDAATAAPAIEQAVTRNWSADSSAAQRLYAFGADAFGLIPQLGRLAAQVGAGMHGLTGELTLGADGMIQRKLIWAQFVDGLPRLLDSVR